MQIYDIFKAFMMKCRLIVVKHLKLTIIIVTLSFIVSEWIIVCTLGFETATLIASFGVIVSIAIGIIQIHLTNENHVEQNIPALAIVDRLNSRIISSYGRRQMIVEFDIENYNSYHAKELKMYYDFESIIDTGEDKPYNGPTFKGTHEACTTPSKSLYSILCPIENRQNNFTLTYVFDAHVRYAGVKNQKYIRSSKIIGHIFFNETENTFECSSSAFHKHSDVLVFPVDDPKLNDFEEKYKEYPDTDIFNIEMDKYNDKKSKIRNV